MRAIMCKEVVIMSAPDKSRGLPRAALSAASGTASRVVLLLFALVLFAACNRMVTPRSAQLVKDADAKLASGDFLDAINLYETALDGSTDSAEIHYRLALLYDERMSDPLSALHHFKRYLTVAPGGPKATEVKNFMKRGELALMTTLSGDSLVTRAEAARLRNENLALRKETAERAAQLRSATSAAEKKGSGARGQKATPAPARSSSPPRSHIVQAGDTLFSLSRLYYNSPHRWKDILEANEKGIDDPEKLKLGQTLTIP
jgi:tetratricopeptide (TPR) repeat protein